MDYCVIQSYLCCQQCPAPHIQIAVCLITGERKGNRNVLNGVWLVLEIALHSARPQDPFTRPGLAASAYVLEERRENRWVLRNESDLELTKKWACALLKERCSLLIGRYRGSGLGKTVMYASCEKRVVVNPQFGDVLLCTI